MWPLLLLLINPILGLDMGIEMFKEILNFPLRSNPFFAKIISLGDNFDADGIEDGEADNSGYVCQNLGDLECQDGYKPMCSGLGVIDCAGPCAGTEEQFKHFMEVMEDKDFDKKFPELAKVKMSQKKKAEETKEDKMEEIPLDGEPPEEKESVEKRFMNGLLKCTNFSVETKSMLSIASGGGLEFNQDTSDPNSKVFVDPSALSAISEVEYDYSDLYDYEDDEEEEGDAGKSRRETTEEVTTTQLPVTTTTVETTMEMPTKAPVKMDTKKPVKTKLSEQQKNMKTQFMTEKEDGKKTEDEKISMNVIRSAGNEEEASLKATTDLGNTTASPPPSDSEPEPEPDHDEEPETTENITEVSRPERIKRELAELHDLFDATMAAASPSQPSRVHVSVAKDPYAHRLARKLNQRMKRAEMSTEAGSTMAPNMSIPDPDACVVKNMTCIKFPSRKHCTGIALGRCGSRTDLLVAFLSALFTPHVVMVTIVSVFVFVIVTIGLSYYCYRLKAENKVVPAEGSSVTGEEDTKDAQVKVQPAPEF